MADLFCVHCGENIGLGKRQEAFDRILDEDGAGRRGSYYEVHVNLCCAAAMRMDEEDLEGLVSDLYEEIIRIGAWDQPSSDFVDDMVRRFERDDCFEPSRKQILYICKLHMIFCEGVSDLSAAVMVRHRRDSDDGYDEEGTNG